METKWFKEALFGGQSSNGFKLGTVLTLGWFWGRVGGCTVLYRGDSMEEIDFDNILAVVDAGAESISPPSYVQHNNNSDYFYVVRRVNKCGAQEHTLSGAVKVSIDGNGELALPRPNEVFRITAKQLAGNKVRLVWYYCPIGQLSQPECFKIYSDVGTGQIDFENPICTVDYFGRRFYSYQSQSLQGDRYLFAIRAEDAAGRDNESLNQIVIEFDTTNPDGITILGAETV